MSRIERPALACEDRKFAILVAGHDEPIGFTALYGRSDAGRSAISIR